jgi:hypothetical protein
MPKDTVIDQEPPLPGSKGADKGISLGFGPSGWRIIIDGVYLYGQERLVEAGSMSPRDVASLESFWARINKISNGRDWGRCTGSARGLPTMTLTGDQRPRLIKQQGEQSVSPN